LTTAEKAFARESVEKGMRTAFLDALSDDGMVFEGALSRNGDLGFLWGNIELVPPRRPAIICAPGARTDRAGGS
jgi:hypothetical protein